MMKVSLIAAIVSLVFAVGNFLVSLFESPQLSYASPPCEDVSVTGRNYRTPFVADRHRWLMKIYSSRV